MDVICLLSFYAAMVTLQKMILPDVAVKWVTFVRCVWEGGGSYDQNLARRPATFVDIFCGFPQSFHPNNLMVWVPQIML
jgi:hypothetical protein